MRREGGYVRLPPFGAGQAIGLGTGRAASAFIRALAASGLEVRGVATSRASAELARSLKIDVVELRAAPKLDADFDGADEVDGQLNMIKGLGGAMVREKVVATASRKRIFLVGEEKLVKRLGQHGNLPVEVVPFAESFVERQITPREEDAVNRLGIPGVDFRASEVRRYPMGPVVSQVMGRIDC